MFAPARFPALALPEDVGGMLLDDGGVEVACTPLHAVASVARHDVVGAPRDASPSMLKRAYRARALRMHPDKSKAPDAEDRFRELQAAYDVLSDARERAAYDRETFV